VSIISIPLALRCAAASAVHPANPPAFYRGCTTALSAPL
jgi:hypothetical protein